MLNQNFYGYDSAGNRQSEQQNLSVTQASFNSDNQATGALVSRLDYDPWGRVSVVSGTTLPDFQYAGYYAHAPSGLNLTPARAYDPNTARWLSRDPLPGAEFSQGTNLYAYCGNDPVNATDPSGLFYDGEMMYMASLSGWFAWNGDGNPNNTGWQRVSNAGPGGAPNANNNVAATPSAKGPQSTQAVIGGPITAFLHYIFRSGTSATYGGNQ